MHDRTLVFGTGGFVIAAGVAFTLVRFFGKAPPARNLETALGAVAFGAVIAAPGVLALLAVPDRPALLVPAAVVLVPLSFLSFALVTLPLLIPAVLLIRAWARTAPPGTAGQAALVTVTVVLPLLAALLALFANQDPREYRTDDAGYSTSDIVTCAESALSLGLSALAVAAGRFLTR